MQETWVRSPGQEDALEEEMAACSNILVWIIPWTEEPGGLQFMGLQKVGHHWAHTHTHTRTHTHPGWLSRSTSISWVPAKGRGSFSYCAHSSEQKGPHSPPEGLTFLWGKTDLKHTHTRTVNTYRSHGHNCNGQKSNLVKRWSKLMLIFENRS